ncbi:aspartyl protease family protein At5g10770-like [Aegilops tauschii subsp. strangulata]|uniref:aspartyl protease family protein At5g10770-like n=1 Tax=Aegilops tauschii subsp. strangulata TaxID=200361 RepID=UPI003CC87E51
MAESGRGDGASQDGGGGIAGRLPVAHRLNPCSPYAGAKSQGEPSESAADVLRRDALGLRSLYGDSGSASDVTIPSTGSPLVAYPGASEYHVVVGYGTPLQRLAVGFDTASSGQQGLRPVPVVHARPNPCNSLDCPLSACSGPSCTFSVSKNDTVVLNGTVVTDTLALSGSTTMQGFRFACLETGYAGSSRTVDDTPSGVLDLSRDIHSLASRAPFSPDTVAFSYCLPSDTTSHGFLSIAAARPELSGRFVSYATLRTSPARPNLYLVQLTAISVGGKDIPVPPAGLAGDSLIALRTTFTYLRPDIYAALRDAFVGQMSRYRHRRAPPVGELDTCYDFAGLRSVLLPAIALQFDGGASMYLDIEHVFYLEERHSIFAVACLAFAAATAYPVGSEAPVAVIGTLAQAATEVAYELHGGKVGFVRGSC